MYFAASNSSGGSFTPFLIVVAIGLLVYFLLLRPARRRQMNAQRTQQEMRSNVSVGTRVVTIGGLYGTVVGKDAESVTLEISPGVTARYDRNAIGRVLTDDEATSPAAGYGHDDGVVDGADLDDVHSSEAEADPGVDGHRPADEASTDGSGTSRRSTTPKND